MLRPKRRKRTYRPIRRKYIKTNFVFTENEIQNVINIYKEKRDIKIKEQSLLIQSKEFLKPKKQTKMKNLKIGKTYTLKRSQTFLNKYQDPTPSIIIEDTYRNVFKKDWQDNLHNPATISFLSRIQLDKLKSLIGENVYYGKIFTQSNNFGIGECVFESELIDI
jgi:hypothetical protein